MKKITFFLLSLVLCLASCEFDSDKTNYIERENPLPTPPMIALDLAGIAPGSTIEVYGPTKFVYHVASNGHSVYDVQFSIDPMSSWSELGAVNINPENFNKETVPLNVTVSLNAEPGSVAEILGAKYTGVFTYYLKYVKTETFDLKLAQKCNSDGYSEISWSHLNLKDAPVEAYYLEFYDKILEKMESIRIAPNGQTRLSYVDKSYAYGSRVYTLVTKFANDRMSSFSSYVNAESKLILDDEVVIEDDLESIKIFWPSNEYKCKYVINVTSGNISDRPMEVNETSILLKGDNAFPRSYRIELVVVPEYFDLKKHEYRLADGAYTDFVSPTLMDDLRPTSFDLKNNKLYVMDTTGKMYAYNSANPAETPKLLLTNYTWHNYPRVSPRTGEILFNENEYNKYMVTIYDADFKVKYLYTKASEHSPIVENTDGETITASMKRYEQPSVDILNKATGQNLYSIPLQSTNSEVIVSSSGKYLVDLSMQKTKLYVLTTSGYSLKHDFSDKHIESALFSGYNPDQLIINYANYDFEILDVSTMSWSGKQNTGKVLAVDPYSGNLLINTRETNIYSVVKKDFSEHISRIPVLPSYSYNTHLINDFLYIDKSYLDLNKKLAK